jgi:hypothetical protein
MRYSAPRCPGEKTGTRSTQTASAVPIEVEVEDGVPEAGLIAHRQHGGIELIVRTEIGG